MWSYIKTFKILTLFILKLSRDEVLQAKQNWQVYNPTEATADSINDSSVELCCSSTHFQLHFTTLCSLTDVLAIQ